MAEKETPAEATQRRTISILGREIRLPESRNKRIALGVGLTILGLLGFLPILGFWMIPVGLLLLSYEFASIRRYRRRGIVRWKRWRKGRDEEERSGDSQSK
ncbi:hypothetical protein [Pseudaminobacter soli (ex Li et al. 2025)]|uniref:Uncharacterized protein n=1 Tax=Pseudaminobacter soli (ex Li et al. 2025) TaxID=1295366 RepID=A0A2P7S7X9_9HYPH|nr:hypothetical protein [Mesorhizobium soli]PSJ58593.1 hypothetical protein C7I85_19615 [Mesorhizobium soli]